MDSMDLMDLMDLMDGMDKVDLMVPIIPMNTGKEKTLQRKKQLKKGANSKNRKMFLPYPLETIPSHTGK